jgi:hypothetical protein
LERHPSWNVIPAKAGIHVELRSKWIPAFAGMAKLWPRGNDEIVATRE